jgi:NTE family protein
MAERDAKIKIAVACQGGGSQTAYTAGALQRILRDDDVDRRFEIVALSGTSGGAVCCLLAWYGLLAHSDRTDGRGARAAELLSAFWDENSAHD